MSLRVRAAVVRIVDRGASTTVIGRGGVARRFDGESAALLAAVLSLHEQAIDRAGLFAALAELSGGEVPAAPVDELVTLLEGEGVLVPAKAPATRPLLARRVVLAISGAIAAVDAPAMIRGLHALGCDVQVAMTRSARQFVAPRALAAITHHPISSSLWQGRAAAPAPHIDLAEWAELVVVCPASATTLARLAAGDASELVAAVVCATRAPVIVAPSMNDGMLASPAVQANLAKLREHGRWLVHAARGTEVAHTPEARRAMLGPAPPASAVIEIVRHVLAQTAAAPRLPSDAAGWAQLWAQTPPEAMPWHVATLTGPLADELAADGGGRSGVRRLLDVGTGNGAVAIAAARAGFAVTASEIAPAALALAKVRSGDAPIVFVLDDITRSTLPEPFDVVVDRGVLHGLPPRAWPGYVAEVTRLVAVGGRLLLVAHTAAGARATTPITAAELAALLTSFELSATHATTLSGGPASLFVLTRREMVKL